MNNELKQIVIETDGVWPEGALETYMSDGRVCIIFSEWNPKSDFCVYFTRQQYEQCLQELTGRPPVSEWPEGYNWFAVDSLGDSHFYDCKQNPYHDDDCWLGKTGNTRPANDIDDFELDWTKTLISREEAAKRDAIIDGDLKICNQSCREFVLALPDNDNGLRSAPVLPKGVPGNISQEHPEIKWDNEGNVVKLYRDRIERYYTNGDPLHVDGWTLRDSFKLAGDWFRNGEAPPVGEKVKMLTSNQCRFEYGADRHGLTGIVMTNYMSGEVPVTVVEYDGVGYCFSTMLIYPSDFNLDAIHEEALIVDNSMRADAIIKKYGGKKWSDGTKSAAANIIIKMIKDGVL